MARSVLDGRRLRFTKTDREERYPSLGPEYEVAALATGAASPAWILLGYIEATEVSTDRHYGRIRSPGKGRRAWRAKVPREHRIGSNAYLQGYRVGGFRLVGTGGGVDYETRAEAADALVLWHDDPKKRRGIDITQDEQIVIRACLRASMGVSGAPTDVIAGRTTDFLPKRFDGDGHQTFGKKRVRESLLRLEARGAVAQPKRGWWHVVEPAREWVRWMGHAE